MDIRSLGHSAFALEHDGTAVLIGPFLAGNPKAAASADDIAADAIVLAHGHGDHLGDAVAIAKRTGAPVPGDTALFGDLALPKRRGHPDVAPMCIGGHHTMDRFDAVVAAELVGADRVIPCHYDTFPPIETDAQAFKTDVQNAGYAQVVVLAPGETHTP